MGCASDASKIGGAFTTPKHYGFYTWCECCVEKVKHDMTTLELGAILIGLFTIIAGTLTTRRVLWITDNEASAHDYAKGYSSDCPVRSAIVKEIHHIVIQHNIDFKLQWITRKSIKSADILTRGSDFEFLAKKGEKRSYRHPYSGQSVLLLSGPKKEKNKPAKMAFAHFHPEISR